MSTVKKGTLAKASDWAKHLRKFGKKVFWKNERREQKKDISKQNKEELAESD